MSPWSDLGVSMYPVMMTDWIVKKLLKGPAGSGASSTIWMKENKNTDVCNTCLSSLLWRFGVPLDLLWPAATGGRSCPGCGWQEAGSGPPAGPRWCQQSPGSQRCYGCHSEPGRWRWNRPTWHCTGSPPGWSQWCHSPQLGQSCLRNRKKKLWNSVDWFITVGWLVAHTWGPVILRRAVINAPGWL